MDTPISFKDIYKDDSRIENNKCLYINQIVMQALLLLYHYKKQFKIEIYKITILRAFLKTT